MHKITIFNKEKSCEKKHQAVKEKPVLTISQEVNNMLEKTFLTHKEELYKEITSLKKQLKKADLILVKRNFNIKLYVTDIIK